VCFFFLWCTFKTKRGDKGSDHHPLHLFEGLLSLQLLHAVHLQNLKKVHNRIIIPGLEHDSPRSHLLLVGWTHQFRIGQQKSINLLGRMSQNIKFFSSNCHSAWMCGSDCHSVYSVDGLMIKTPFFTAQSIWLRLSHNSLVLHCKHIYFQSLAPKRIYSHWKIICVHWAENIILKVCLFAWS
jgi:hypothetical protein